MKPEQIIERMKLLDEQMTRERAELDQLREGLNKHFEVTDSRIRLLRWGDEISIIVVVDETSRDVKVTEISLAEAAFMISGLSKLTSYPELGAANEWHRHFRR